MLRRFLQSRSSDGANPDSPTYAETLLESALPIATRALSGGDDLDPVEAVARAIVEAEVDAGLSDGPEEEGPRDQFARTYALLLLDNDRQPAALQMSADDLLKPRGLLQSFFTGAPTMQSDASTVLRFIEERFAERCYGQARLLLQLFDTDAGTRRNNERNLFYEEMILRFLAPREESIPTPEGSEDEDSEGEVSEDDTLDLRQAAEALAEAYAIRLHTFGQDPLIQPPWTALWSTLGKSDAGIEDIIAGPRWRPHWRKSEHADALLEHFEYRGTRAFVENLTRCIYFITLAPGATGFEHLVSKYLDWMGDHYQMVPTRILPLLHRLVNVEEMSLSEGFDMIWYDLDPREDTQDEPFSRDEVQAVADQLANDLAEADLSGVPSGDYDLGGVVTMRLFGFEPGDIATELRINRVT